MNTDKILGPLHNGEMMDLYRLQDACDAADREADDDVV